MRFCDKIHGCCKDDMMQFYPWCINPEANCYKQTFERKT